MSEVGISFGPGALRAPAGPLPGDPRDDGEMPAELQALKQEAERRITEWATTGHGLVSSSLYEACAWFSTGLGDRPQPRRANRLLSVRVQHRHLAAVPACRYQTSISTTRPGDWRLTPRA